MLFGAICGFLLSVDETAWWVTQALAAIGGVLGGMEMGNPRDGALRASSGGLMLGLRMIAAHESTGREALAQVPEPLGLLLVFLVLGGVVLGASAERWANAAVTPRRLRESR